MVCINLVELQFFLDIYPGMNYWIIWQFCFFVFWGISIVFSIGAVPVCISIIRVEGSLFSTSPSAFVICRLFSDGSSDQYEVVPHCTHFICISKCLAMNVEILSCACCPSVCLWRNVYLGLMLFFWWSCWFFGCYSCMSYLYILEIKLLLVSSFANIFFQSIGCLFVYGFLWYAESL